MSLFLCGDVMLGRGIDQVLPFPNDPQLHEGYVASASGYVRLAEQANGPVPRPVDFSYIWGSALDEFRRVRPDLRIINLETSITRSNTYVPKGINYRMSPENVGCILAAEIDCCTLANNHVLDWGVIGLLETLDTLGRNGVSTAGAGRNLAEAMAPAILDISGKGRAIVFAYATATSGTPSDWAATPRRPGVNFLPDLSERTCERIAAQVQAVKRVGDVVIVSIHWGPNWSYDVPEQHRRFAHGLIDLADISIVHGHSSHHPIGIEVYRDRLVLYGCGDFLNDYEGIRGYEEFRGDLSLMYFAKVDLPSGRLLGLEMMPLQMRRFRLNQATSEDAEWLRRTLDRESRRFGASVGGASGDQLVLHWSGRSAAVQETESHVRSR